MAEVREDGVDCLKWNKNWCCSYEVLKIKIYSYLEFHCLSSNHGRNKIKQSFYSSGPNHSDRSRQCYLKNWTQRNHQTPNVQQTHLFYLSWWTGSSLDGDVARGERAYVIAGRIGGVNLRIVWWVIYTNFGDSFNDVPSSPIPIL